MSRALRFLQRRLSLLWAFVLLFVAGSVAHLWVNVTQVEDALPLASLHKERDFSALLGDVSRLEGDLRLYLAAPQDEHYERLLLALDLAVLRQRDNRIIYLGTAVPGVADMHALLGEALAELDVAVADGAPAATALHAPLAALIAVRERLQILNDTVFQLSMTQASVQRSKLVRLRDTVSAMIVLLGALGVALALSLLRQRRSIAALQLRDRALQAAEEQQRELRERLERVADNVPGMIFQYRRGADGHPSLPYASHGVHEIFGVSAEAAAQDSSVLLDAIHADDRERVIGAFDESARSLLPCLVEFRVVRDGIELWMASHATPQRQADGGTLWHGYTYDVTRRRLAEEEIKHLAFYDALTGLPNRRLLIDRLRHALLMAARNHQGGALLFIDLDNFKTLNDTRGHACGDLLLQQVARRLLDAVRAGDTVARLGGDEFVVMLENIGSARETAAQHAEQVGEKVLAALTQPYLLNGKDYHGTPSIGVALFDDCEGGLEELLKRADLAMYQAKGAGRNTLRFFDPAMQSLLAAQSTLEAEMRQGLRAGDFVLHYQPQLDSGGRLAGVEALVRWQHPQRGLIAPGEFIGLAESSGLIQPLGQWVLEAACEQIARWQRDPELRRLSVAVNVSARQFRHPDFVSRVIGAIERTAIPADRLKLELTESLLLDNVEEIIARMNVLKARGVCFALDDFGTGYSSLAYLKRLPLDQLKIDRSFVRDVLTDPNDAAIARTIIALGQTLGLHVLAEGVETRDQHEFLVAHGCDAFQGYLFGHPQHPDVLNTVAPAH